MIPKIISSNVRELNEVGKMLGVRNLLRRFVGRPYMLTRNKVGGLSRAVVSCLWG